MDEADAKVIYSAKPTAFFDHIEVWWGEPFDGKLIERMAKAPKKHRRAFKENLTPFWANLYLGFPAIPPGVLRPGVATTEIEPRSARRIEGLRLLLYAHEVVLDLLDLIGDLHFWIYQGDTYSGSLKQLAKLRPLIEDGSIICNDASHQRRSEVPS